MKALQSQSLLPARATGPLLYTYVRADTPARVRVLTCACARLHLRLCVRLHSRARSCCVCARSRLRVCARSHLRACARPFSCACALAHLCALARPLRGIFTCTYAPTDPRPRATRPARRPRLKAERLANATARARLLRTRLLFCYHILNLVAKLASRFQLGELL